MSMADAFSSTWGFLREGGFFMILLGVCSVAAVTVIIFKLITLKRERHLPTQLEQEVEKLEREDLAGLSKAFEKGDSTLARLGQVVMSSMGISRQEVQAEVESSAHEELVKMNSGLAALEVIVTISPLLGLLGTASGLVTVFGDLDSKETIQRGIATALSTTVVGIAIAVPAVIAHSYFSRRVERYAVRLEVLLGRVVSASRERVGR